MKTPGDWIKTNVALSIQEIQTDARADLLERIKALEGELSKTDSALRETNFADMLARTRQAEAERDQAKLETTRATVALAHAQNRIEALQPNLDQARAALKLALAELSECRCYCPTAEDDKCKRCNAIAAIKACGVGS